MACILLWSSAVRVHDTQAYRKMDVTRERISLGLGKLQAYPFLDVIFPPLLCLPCLLPPFTVPCQMVLAKLNERET